MPHDRPAARAGWAAALVRGSLAFLVVAGIGQAAALAAYLVADPGLPFSTFLRIGALYLGALHHVAITLEASDVDIGPLVGALPGSPIPSGGGASVSVGIALLGVTAIGVWMLFRAGRASARDAEGAAVAAALGARVAPGYAVPCLLVGLVVRLREDLTVGSSIAGELRVSLSVWQSFVFPMAIAAAAGAAGGAYAVLGSRREGLRPALAGSVLAGGWRMLAVALGLSYAGLFLAGVVQPDGPAAVLTPSTARYYRTVFDRAGVGAVVLAHHVALAPNEAAWTLVPAMGGCDVVGGSVEAEFLCYDRFPRSAGPLSPILGGPSAVARDAVGGAPRGYLLFLLVPALATLLGGRWVARRSELAGRDAALGGAMAGLVFGALVFATCLLGSVTVAYGAAFGEEAGGGAIWIGPDPVGGTLVALAWGVIGGGLGAFWAGGRVRSSSTWRRPLGRISPR